MADDFDPFILDSIFPDPDRVLKSLQPAVTEISKNCLYALDANVMLAVYLLDKDSFKDIEDHFKRLVAAGRLFLPAQAVREFARHRPLYIARAYEVLTKVVAAFPTIPKALQAPLFEELAEYKPAADAIKKVADVISEMKRKFDVFMTAARYQNNNDAASKLFATLFAKDHIITHKLSQDELLKDLARRATHNIPPGFKDKSKPDGGIGDVSIWHSLIALGSEKKRDVILVTNDAKSDWVVGVDKEKPFAPRPELVEEFHQKTGQAFTLVQLKVFLALIGLKDATVANAPPPIRLQPLRPLGNLPAPITLTEDIEALLRMLDTQLAEDLLVPTVNELTISNELKHLMAVLWAKMSSFYYADGSAMRAVKENLQTVVSDPNLLLINSKEPSQSFDTRLRNLASAVRRALIEEQAGSAGFWKWLSSPTSA